MPYLVLQRVGRCQCHLPLLMPCPRAVGATWLPPSPLRATPRIRRPSSERPPRPGAPRVGRPVECSQRLERGCGFGSATLRPRGTQREAIGTQSAKVGAGLRRVLFACTPPPCRSAIRLHRGEPQAGAVATTLRREERLEDMRQHVRRDAASAVHHVDGDGGTARLAGRRLFHRSRGCSTILPPPGMASAAFITRFVSACTIRRTLDADLRQRLRQLERDLDAVERRQRRQPAYFAHDVVQVDGAPSRRRRGARSRAADG